MMKPILLRAALGASLIVVLNLQPLAVLGQGTAFTYQGRLEAGGVAASGSYDFRFRLASDALGNTYVGSPVLTNAVPVNSGLFVVALDFGDVFNGADYWLQVEVRTNGATGYALLSPLQRLLPAPYAQRAANAARLEGQDLAFVRNADNLNAGTVSDERIPAGVTRDSEVMGIVLANDGTGSGLNADMVDGQHSSAFVQTVGASSITGTSVSNPLLTITQSGSKSGLVSSTVSTSPGEAGVVGRAGTAGPSINSVAGVLGTSSSARGVIGSSTSSNGVFGYSSSAAGIKGESQNSTGVEGFSFRTSGTAYGVRGESLSSNGGAGVYGESSYVGVWGESAGRWGVYGRTTGTSNSYGIYGAAGAGTGNYAGYFSGNVSVVGVLSKGGGSFKIDHPLDPENKFLSHSFVESPDMMNVYNGNATLDDRGEAWVQLPAYFEALNRDFRYQLTALGAPAPNLHIAEPVRNNRFKIGGGASGLQVSWQVTGIRQDPFANANRIVVEEPKPVEERGTYLHAEAYDVQEQARTSPRRSAGHLRDPRSVGAPAGSGSSPPGRPASAAPR